MTKILILQSWMGIIERGVHIRVRINHCSSFAYSSLRPLPWYCRFTSYYSLNFWYFFKIFGNKLISQHQSSSNSRLIKVFHFFLLNFVNSRIVTIKSEETWSILLICFSYFPKPFASTNGIFYIYMFLFFIMIHL